MLPKPSQQPESPRIRANPLSILSFAWLISLLKKGSHKDLRHEDIYRVLPENETKILADTIEAAWLEQVAKAEEKNKKRAEGGTKNGKEESGGDNQYQVDSEKSKPSLIRALVKVFGPRMAFFGIFALLAEAVIKIAQPIILGYLFDYFNNPQEFQPYEGYLYGAAVIGLCLLHTSIDHPFIFAVQHLGMKMRISLCALIHRKALRVSKYALEQTQAGQITNLLSSDMNRFDIFFTFSHYIWIAPIQLINVIIVLYFHADLGYASLAGLVLIFVFMPFQGYMGFIFSKLRTQTAQRTDERMLVLEEILTAMRVIKMYTWEGPFSDSAAESRKAEIRKLKTRSICRALNESFLSVSSRTTLFITLLVYVLSGHTLTTKKVYVTLMLYQAVQFVTAYFFPLGMIATAETLVALRRIRKFLLMDEKTVPVVPIRDSNQDRIRKYDWALASSDDVSISSQYTYTTASFVTTSYGEIGVWAHGISAQWSPHAKELSFSNVSFDVRGGEVLAIIGPTAGGKSSILNTLLYELPLKYGEFKMVGQVAYSSQEPWVFNGSVRDNILFGKPYNPSWYDEVAEACALAKDFELLPYGDRTLVGEKGSELSGGQKARVSLARAVYADADIYLLDDPLSAVDAQVGRHIVKNCILGLLKNKCRILVTHQLQHVKLVDKVVVMVDGYMAHVGDYKSLRTSGIPFSELLQSSPENRSVNRILSSRSIASRKSSTGAGGMTSEKAPAIDRVPVKVRDVVVQNGPQEIEEFIAKGSVGLKTLYRYFHSGSSVVAIILLVFLYLVTQCLFTGTDLWLQYWIKIDRQINAGVLVYSHNSFIRIVQENRMVRLGIYTALICSVLAMVLFRTQMFFRGCMKSSVVIYERLFYGVVRSPISFFETTPVGRILNRFAKDISIIDENLPQAMYYVSDIFMHTISILLLISINTYVMIAPCLILVLLLYFLRKFYFRSAVCIGRLEAVARSPILNHLSTTLMGLPTIRAFGVEEKFMKDFEDIQDVHTSCSHLYLCASRWLGITVDWIVVVFVSGVVLTFLINLDTSRDNLVGITLTLAMMLTRMLQWGLRQSAEVENHLISFERVSEYCQLEPEAALESEPDKKPPPTWPSSGEIKIRNLCLRYSLNSGATVLKNISCTISGGEKVGIVGRTGAGKSSLINVLFRLVEPTSGYIEIDGIETTSIGLHDLRSKISIIPQEPVIFGGTVRTNLDPFAEYSDAQLWNSLQEVHLTETVKLMDGGLNSEISEGGSIFSSGQKQLFCLARCILKSNRILVLDEATANIDPETDRLIQQTIRNNFSECTVLTIAHRLHTVIDSDRIIVLHQGQIMEFDEPITLLSNRHSMLYYLVQQIGKAEASNLAQMAKIAAQLRHESRNSRTDHSSYTTVTEEFII